MFLMPICVAWLPSCLLFGKKLLNEKLNPEISKLLNRSAVQAMHQLRKLIHFGVPGTKNKPEPTPENAAQAAKYADIRYRACCRILDLRFGTKPRGAMTPEARDEEMEQLKAIAALPWAERKQMFDDAVSSGRYTVEEAQELRLVVEEIAGETPEKVAGPGEDH